MSILMIIGLLILLAIAVQRSGMDYQWVVAYAVLISALTYWVYGRDKRTRPGLSLLMRTTITRSGYATGKLRA